MKRLLLSLCAVLGIQFAGGAQSVDWQLTELTNAIPAGVAGSPATNSPGKYFSAENWRNVAFQFSYALAGSVTASNVTVVLEKSIDTTNWTTLDTIGLLSANTATVSYVTNYDVGAIPYLRVGRIINANLTNVVGLSFWMSRKRGL